MPDLSMIISGISVFIFMIALLRGREMVIPAIVASEFIFSGGLVSTLVGLDSSGGLLFYANYTITGLLSVLIAVFIAAYFLIMEISRSAAIISVLYFLYGCFAFLIVVESIPLNGSYPFELIGLYNYIEFINSSFCVLILLVTGFNVVGGNGFRIRNFFNMRSGNAGGDQYVLFNRQGCGENSNNKARTCK